MATKIHKSKNIKFYETRTIEIVADNKEELKEVLDQLNTNEVMTIKEQNNKAIAVTTYRAPVNLIWHNKKSIFRKIIDKFYSK